MGGIRWVGSDGWDPMGAIRWVRSDGWGPMSEIRTEIRTSPAGRSDPSTLTPSHPTPSHATPSHPIAQSQRALVPPSQRRHCRLARGAAAGRPTPAPSSPPASSQARPRQASARGGRVASRVGKAQRSSCRVTRWMGCSPLPFHRKPLLLPRGIQHHYLGSAGSLRLQHPLGSTWDPLGIRLGSTCGPPRIRLRSAWDRTPPFGIDWTPPDPNTCLGAAVHLRRSEELNVLHAAAFSLLTSSRRVWIPTVIPTRLGGAASVVW